VLAGTIFCNGFKAICLVQSRRQKDSCFRSPQIKSTTAPSRPERGAYRDRHVRWAGMRWTRQRRRAWASQGGPKDPWAIDRRADERRWSVRQNRVVLAPVAGVKLAEAFLAQPGFDKPLICWRRWQDEFVAGESTA